MNRDNLETLAAYLEGLPADYGHFDMASYLRKDDHHIYMTAQAHTIHDCGTVGCAVGHGPAAGIAPLYNEDWDAYSDRVFPTSTMEWSWCFSSSWALVDNTPHGAAKRIRYMLEHGVPADSRHQQTGEAPYIFAKEEAA